MLITCGSISSTAAMRNVYFITLSVFMRCAHGQSGHFYQQLCILCCNDLTDTESEFQWTICSQEWRVGLFEQM